MLTYIYGKELKRSAMIDASVGSCLFVVILVLVSIGMKDKNYELIYGSGVLAVVFGAILVAVAIVLKGGSGH